MLFTSVTRQVPSFWRIHHLIIITNTLRPSYATSSSSTAALPCVLLLVRRRRLPMPAPALATAWAAAAAAAAADMDEVCRVSDRARFGGLTWTRMAASAADTCTATPLEAADATDATTSWVLPPFASCRWLRFRFFRWLRGMLDCSTSSCAAAKASADCFWNSASSVQQHGLGD